MTDIHSGCLVEMHDKLFQCVGCRKPHRYRNSNDDLANSVAAADVVVVGVVMTHVDSNMIFHLRLFDSAASLCLYCATDSMSPILDHNIHSCTFDVAYYCSPVSHSTNRTHNDTVDNYTIHLKDEKETKRKEGERERKIPSVLVCCSNNDRDAALC